MRFQVVSFHCVLKNKLGRLISTSFNQDVETRISEGEAQALPGFTKALANLKAGEQKKIFVPANEAYGFYDPSLQVQTLRSKLKNGKTLKLGDEVTGSVNGKRDTKLFRVVSANSRHVVLDANHPLAGQDLVFDVEMMSSKEVIEENVPRIDTPYLN
jgi:FKBP-type peptidyl-prolyl cis-trans isomerase SlyD